MLPLYSGLGDAGQAQVVAALATACRELARATPKGGPPGAVGKVPSERELGRSHLASVG